MADKTIAIRLAPRLEAEGRGFCDPGDLRNNAVISARNYGSEGYLRVHPSGFIQALIQSGALIKVSAEQRKTTGEAEARTPGRKKTAGRGRRKPDQTGRREG